MTTPRLRSRMSAIVGSTFFPEDRLRRRRSFGDISITLSLSDMGETSLSFLEMRSH
jgi:hypothetical protein